MKNIIQNKSKKENGFTLIELLVVIVVIGILASISIPIFQSQRGKSQDAATISDVKNMVTAVETFLVNDKVSNVSPQTIDVRTSPYVTYNIIGNTSSNGYCIVAYNPRGDKYNSNSSLVTYDSTAGGLFKSNGSCSNLTVANSSTGSTGTSGGSTGVGSETVSGPSTPSASYGGNSTGVGSATSLPATETVSYTCSTGTLNGVNCNAPARSYAATGTAENYTVRSSYTYQCGSHQETRYYNTYPYTRYEQVPDYCTGSSSTTETRTVYSCPEGGTLNETTCNVPATTNPAQKKSTYTCPAGYNLNATVCTKNT